VGVNVLEDGGTLELEEFELVVVVTEGEARGAKLGVLMLSASPKSTPCG
jgi:hypothetical protein